MIIMTRTRFINLLSLIFNVAIVVMVIYSVVFMFLYPSAGNMEAAGIIALRYFTVDSNILVMFTSLMIIPFNIQALISGEDEIPIWAIITKAVGTTAVGVTFFTVILFLAPATGFNYKLFYEDSTLYLHGIIPLVAMLSFIFFENKRDYDWEWNIFAIAPTFIYSIFYLIFVAFSKTWPDFYGFTFGGKMFMAPISMIVMYAVSFGIVMGLWKIRKIMTRKYYWAALRRFRDLDE